MEKFCSCGAKVLDGQRFCPKCGSELNISTGNVDSGAGISRAEPAAQKNAQEKKQPFVGIAAAVCGILSILLCLVPVAGLVLGIAAVVLGQIGLSKKQEYKTGMSLEGLITGVIGAILGLIPVSVKYMYIFGLFR